MQSKRYIVCYLFFIMGLLAVTAVNPYDRKTWLMEVAPVLIAGPLLIATYRRFPLTPLLYSLIFLHSIVLITGGAYTYARVPLGFLLQDAFSFGRNNYDRIGHFFQGFVPAVVSREILLRSGYVTHRKMAAFLSLCVAMSISAWYELIEWAAALVLGQAADEFLGTQGDVWDTQWDMFMCFIGATFALFSLSRIHDRQIEILKNN